MIYSNTNNHDADREQMVNDHLLARDITDKRVIEILRKIPRERFIDSGDDSRAYNDNPLPIGCGQTISQPYMVALMTQSLLLGRSDRVLEIGTGSGYQTAVLAEIAKEVYTVERIDALGLRAQNTLAELGYSNIKFKIGDGTLGWEEHAPFDRIIVTAGAPELPLSLTDQLADGGMMVIPVGGTAHQDLIRAENHGSKIVQKKICSCIFVKLIGKEGWEE